MPATIRITRAKPEVVVSKAEPSNPRNDLYRVVIWKDASTKSAIYYVAAIRGNTVQPLSIPRATKELALDDWTQGFVVDLDGVFQGAKVARALIEQGDAEIVEDRSRSS
jgi:hypothetical protein